MGKRYNKSPDDHKSNNVSSRKSKSREYSEADVLKTKSVKNGNTCKKESWEQKESGVAMKVRFQLEEGAESEFTSDFGSSERSY